MGKTECEVESTFRYGLIAISFLLYESGKYKILVCQNFIYIPGDVAWWQRVWDLHSRSRVRVRACTSCKILGQPVFYSLTWAHKVRFPGSVVSSNPKKKKKPSYTIHGKNIQMRIRRNHVYTETEVFLHSSCHWTIAGKSSLYCDLLRSFLLLFSLYLTPRKENPFSVPRNLQLIGLQLPHNLVRFPALYAPPPQAHDMCVHGIRVLMTTRSRIRILSSSFIWWKLSKM